MNYTKIYNDLCNRGQLVDIKNTEIYYEKHHIIPVFMYKNNTRKTRYKCYQVYDGNPNSQSNVTYLTPREHFIAHVLLYMMYKNNKQYSNPMSKALLLFFKTEKDSIHKRNINYNLKNSKLYEQMRSVSRKEQSFFMKGKIVVKDEKTGEKIGLVSNTHENVINGKWVHHTKGRKINDLERQMRSEMGTGKNNNNYKELTTELEKIIFKIIYETSILITGIRYIHLKNMMLEVNNNEYVTNNYKKISYVFFKNKYGSTENLIKIYNEKSSLGEVNYKKYGKLKGTGKNNDKN